MFLSLIFFQLFQRRFLVFFYYFIFNTYWEKRCTIQLHRPLSKKSNAAISSGFSFQTLSTQLPQTQPAETWYFMFLGCRIFFFSPSQLPRGGDTAKLSWVESGQRNRCPQFHLSFLLQLHYVSAVIETIFATLPQRWNSCREVEQHFCCRWELIYFGCELILTWDVTKHRRGNLDLCHLEHRTTSTRNLKIGLLILKKTCLLRHAAAWDPVSDGAGQTGQKTQNSSSGTCDIFSEAIVCFI